MTKAIPIATIAIFILIMTSGGYLKRPLGDEDSFSKMIEDITTDVNDGAWDRADSNAKNLVNTWNRIVIRIQFSTEQEEIDDISTSLARLHGAVAAEDKTNALIELKEAYNHWINIGK
jgi:hypothetical protein